MFETYQQQTTRQIAQKFIKNLNKTADQDEDTYQPRKRIQYLRRFYQQQNSLEKLKKLIDYSTLNFNKQRYLHPKAKRLQKNNIRAQQNGKSPALSSSSLQIKFPIQQILTPSILKSRNSISYIREIVSSLERKEQKKQKKVPLYKFGLIDKKLSKTLNYIPYRSRKNITTAIQTKFKGQLQNIQQKWIKTTKILNKSRQ